MITSMANPKIKQYQKLLKKKYRREYKLFIVEGFNMLEEAQKNAKVIDVITTNEKINGTLVAPFIFEKLTDSVSPQPVIGIVKMPKHNPLGKRVLVLNNVQDPGNVGTLIRSAKAFGFTDVIVQGVDVYSPKTLRSSQGAIFGINVIQTRDVVPFLSDYQVIGAMLDKDAQIYDDIKLQSKFILILGNESQGVEKKIQKFLTDKVYIPIDFESLNVASAGAILLNQYKKSN
ncbi:TrmH family RNA methyltransferase [Candidatus Mycoplasma mahonii]|uniref:TrmH family RNA methyltransferase n=1 Tax=Candidatus Mycoplasma mahonii TaxID=3004105 RepID=UPI0026F20D18|nr:RNA methyltransferase [Candidatus Mycoplasma mahonii]WKX02677.1 RNA methyltransferase [Candidatus Mycoplasma mahonii]